MATLSSGCRTAPLRAGVMAAALLSICALSAPVRAEPPAALLPFVPGDARTVVGFDLQPGSYDGFTTVARAYLNRSAHARQALMWLDEAQVDRAPISAMVIEDEGGRTATVLRFEALRDSHWLRLAAFMGAYAMEAQKARGVDLWLATEQTAQKDKGLESMAVARLNDQTLVAGHEVVVKAIGESTRNRARRPKGALADGLAQLPRIASAWFVGVGGDAPEGQTCGGGASGHLVLDDGMLLELRWGCDDPEAAVATRDRLRKGLQGEELALELAHLAGALAVARGTLIQQVGAEVIAVTTASDADTRAILDQLEVLFKKTP